MEIIRRWTPLLVFAVVVLALLRYLVRWLAARPWFASSLARRKALHWISAIAALWIAAIPLIYAGDLDNYLPATGAQWVLAVTFFWAASVLCLVLYVWTTRHEPQRPSRRLLLQSTAGIAASAPLIASGVGILIARSGATLREVDIPIPNLPRDLHGLRIAQLSDIHFGPFLGAKELSRAIAMANENRPHLTVVTGDFITRRIDLLQDCLALLRNLKAEAGVYGCNGNHEMYAHAEGAASRAAARLGIRILRKEAVTLRFGTAKLNMAGFDYQRLGSSYLPNAEALIDKDAFNLLLQHNPDVFPRAAQAGFQLTLAGHTHGGQVNLELFDQNINVARFFTPWVLGLYRKPSSALYVNPGLGTVGAPIRLGVPPEVTLVRLCAA